MWSPYRFLRDDTEGDESKLSWDERLAKKYYSSLYREYAVCDLKHYKSGNVNVFDGSDSIRLSDQLILILHSLRCAGAPKLKSYQEQGKLLAAIPAAHSIASPLERT